MRRRNVLIALAAFAFGLVIGLLAIREPMQPISAEVLRAAQDRWTQAGIACYVIRYELNADLYEVTVEERIVSAITVNGQPPRTTQLRNYTVEGLFRVLEMEVENLTDPAGPFAAQRDRILARVRFNRELGYPERYLRSSAGVGRPASIRVLEFKPSEEP
jgi:hypothetical protein